MKRPVLLLILALACGCGQEGGIGPSTGGMITLVPEDLTGTYAVLVNNAAGAVHTNCTGSMEPLEGTARGARSDCTVDGPFQIVHSGNVLTFTLRTWTCSDGDVIPETGAANLSDTEMIGRREWMYPEGPVVERFSGTILGNEIRLSVTNVEWFTDGAIEGRCDYQPPLSLTLTPTIARSFSGSGPVHRPR